jgi:hypothetical protein
LKREVFMESWPEDEMGAQMVLAVPLEETTR